MVSRLSLVPAVVIAALVANIAAFIAVWLVR